MFSPSFKKLLAVMLLAAIALALLLQFANSRFKPQAQVEPPKIFNSEPTHHYAPPTFQAATKPAVVNVTTNSDDDQTRKPAISREQAEAWLAKHNRNAMSLLAAFRAMGDTNYLNEAATNFPNDPHVELAVLAHNEFPADRRKWLDLFKNSSPSNSLANYLSAQDYFKNGNKDAAVKELLAASGKTQFEAYATENQLDAEQLYPSSGKSPVETATFAMADMADENMYQMANLKRLGQGIGDLEQQYISSGDANSAVNLAQMGMTIANQIKNGDSGKYLINQLVGVAETSIVLSKLDQNTSYDFLNGETPGQVRSDLKQQKISEAQIVQNFGSLYTQMTPDEMVNYSERAKIYGELPAMKWVIQQHPPTVPQQ